MPVSAVQQSDSVIHAFFFYILIHHGLSQETGYSFLCCTLGPVLFFFFFFFFFVLVPHLGHKEVPWLGVSSELQLPACITATAPDPSHVCDLYHSSRRYPVLNPPTEWGQGATTGTPWTLFFMKLASLVFY